MEAAANQNQNRMVGEHYPMQCIARILSGDAMRSLMMIGYIHVLTLTVITAFDWLNYVTALRNNAFTTSAS